MTLKFVIKSSMRTMSLFIEHDIWYYEWQILFRQSQHPIIFLFFILWMVQCFYCPLWYLCIFFSWTNSEVGEKIRIFCLRSESLTVSSNHMPALSLYRSQTRSIQSLQKLLKQSMIWYDHHMAVTYSTNSLFERQNTLVRNTSFDREVA